MYSLISFKVSAAASLVNFVLLQSHRFQLLSRLQLRTLIPLLINIHILNNFGAKLFKCLINFDIFLGTRLEIRH